LLGALASSGYAGSVLIVNGASVTTETYTTANITNNLQALELAVGNTVTIADAVPTDLSSFDQIWDLRFSVTSPLTAADQAAYTAFLQTGKGMFVMGENSGFTVRNNSVIEFVSALGGGDLIFTSPDWTQTVNAPWTGPNPVTQVYYAAPGGVGVGDSGTGTFMTQADDGSGGSAIAWAPGTLVAAPTATLTVVFDVNFMENTYDVPNSQNFLKNMIGYINTNVENNAVPLPAALGPGLLMLGGWIAAASRRKAKSRIA